MSTIEAGLFYASKRSRDSLNPIGNINIVDRKTPSTINLNRAVEKMDDYILRERLGMNKKPSFEGQVKILQSIRDSFADGISEEFAKACPRYGKTDVYAKTAEALGLKTLIVIPNSTPTMDQVEKSIKECTEGLEVGKVYSLEKVYDKQITIITYASFLKGVEDGSINPKDYGLLILDEGHLAMSKRRQRAVAQFTNAIKLGFTATPDYSKDKRLDQLLPTKICDISIKKGIQDGRLANVKCLVAMVHADGLDKSQDRRVMRVNILMQAALNFYLNHSIDGIPIKGQRTLVYCETIKYAEKLAELFRANGISSEAITGKDSVKNKRLKIARFKNGETAVGVTADLLGIGHDDPNLRVCISLDSTFSPVKAEQRLRNLGKYLNDNSKVAIFADFYLASILRKSRVPISAAATVNETGTIYKIASIVPRGPNKEKAENPTNEVVIFETLDTEKDKEPEIAVIPFRADVEQALEVTRDPEQNFIPIDINQWKSFADAASEFKATEETLLDILRERGIPELEKHGKNWRILEAVDDTGRLTRRLSPFLVDWLGKILMECKTFPIAGGKCVNDVAKEMRGEGYKVSRAMVKESFLRIGRENPNEAGVHIHPKGNKYIRYLSAIAIDLVKKDIIKNKLSYSPPPKDWLTISKLRLRLQKRYGVDYRFVKAAASSLKEEYPEGFGLFRSSDNIAGGVLGVHEHISPEKALMIEEKARIQFESKPPFTELGWMSYGDYRRSRGVHDTKAKKVAGQFRSDHPDWFAINSRATGKPSEHMHPDLVKELDTIFGVGKIFSEYIVFDRRGLIQEERTAIIDN